MRKEIELANIYGACVVLIFMLNILFYFMEETAIFLVFIQTFSESYGSSLFLE